MTSGGCFSIFFVVTFLLNPLGLSTANANEMNEFSINEDEKEEAECDLKCGIILSGKYPDGTPVKKDSELYLKCLAYRQTFDAQIFDMFLMTMDGATFSACTTACVLPTSPAALICDVGQVLSGTAEVASALYMTIKFKHHLGTGEIMGLALGGAGIVMGVGGLKGRF